MIYENYGLTMEKARQEAQPKRGEAVYLTSGQIPDKWVELLKSAKKGE